MVENEMLEDEISIQKNVEKDLFDEQGKILDRFHSLITLTLTVAGFTFTFLSIMFSRNSPEIKKALLSYNVTFSFLCIFTALLLSIINVLAIFHHRKLVNKGGKIGYREDGELVNNNLKLYLDISKQKNYYIIAITLIGIGLTSFINHFSQHHILAIILTTGFTLIVIFLIRNSRQYLTEKED
jgi:hypothetical protein